MDNTKVSASIANFSAKFINELQQGNNVVSSPLSVEFVLALLTLGTSDPAHSELLNALGISDDDAIRSTFGTVSSKLKSIQGVTLNVANKVYIQEGNYDLNEELKNDAVKVFDANLEKIDFADSTTSTRKINEWVEGKTNNKIKDLLSADSVNSDTRLVLVNALYFKGSWKEKFDAQHTTNQPFFLTAEKTVEVPMMYRESTFRYGESEALNAQFLEMDYVGSDASMVIILPNEIDGLKGVLTKLAGGFDLMDELGSKMYSTKVQVSIPKFKIETEIDLKELLPKLGVSAIFDRSKCCLTKLLNNSEPLFVSKAVQKAFIEVNEEGAEAAAATGMVMMMRCARPPPRRFHADRPFLYLLLAANRTILFAGLYVNNA